jgi:hypothetical protein
LAQPNSAPRETSPSGMIQVTVPPIAFMISHGLFRALSNVPQYPETDFGNCLSFFVRKPKT